IRNLVAPIAIALLLLTPPVQAQEIEQGQPTKPPATRPTTQPSSDQRIAQLEAQVQTLTKALEELRKGPTTAKSPTTAPSTPAFVLDFKYQQSLTWRSIGPAGMGGRIVDFAVVESDPSTFFVATASGGLLKTINNGYSFTHLFDH